MKVTKVNARSLSDDCPLSVHPQKWSAREPAQMYVTPRASLKFAFKQPVLSISNTYLFKFFYGGQCHVNFQKLESNGTFNSIFTVIKMAMQKCPHNTNNLFIRTLPLLGILKGAQQKTSLSIWIKRINSNFGNVIFLADGNLRKQYQDFVYSYKFVHSLVKFDATILDQSVIFPTVLGNYDKITNCIYVEIVLNAPEIIHTYSLSRLYTETFLTCEQQTGISLVIIFIAVHSANKSLLALKQVMYRPLGQYQ